MWKNLNTGKMYKDILKICPKHSCRSCVLHRNNIQYSLFQLDIVVYRRLTDVIPRSVDTVWN